MKGQSSIFEEIILFGISVFIFITLFFVFNSFQAQSLKTTGNDMIEEISNYIISTIVEISAVDGDYSVIISIPERINNQPYIIVLNDTGYTLKVEPDGPVYSSNIYGIQNSGGIEIEDNTIASISKKMMIYKRAGKIGINSINI